MWKLENERKWVKEEYKDFKSKREIVIIGRRINMKKYVMMRRKIGGKIMVGGDMGLIKIIGLWMMKIGMIVI